MSEVTTLPLKNMICSGYGKFWRSRCRYVVCKGSRGSGKSKTAALWHIVMMMKYPLANTLVIRKTERTLRDSCFADLKWAIHRLGVDKLWKVTTSPLQMEYIPTGQKILFRGLDDGYKITSISVSPGYLCWVLIEEAYEITKEEDFDKLDESIRGELPDGYFKRLTLIFNPWSERHWLKSRFFDTPSEDTLAMTTTYKQNPWLDSSDLQLFENMRLRNPRRYKVAALGEWGVVDGLVYENWEEYAFRKGDIENIPGIKSVFGLDFGYTTDPSAFVAAYVDQAEKVIYVFDEMYQQKMQNSAIYDWISKHGYAKERIIADSQEPKSIDQLKSLGLYRIEGAVKGPDSILYGIQLMQDYKIMIHPRCVNTLTEISSYCWKKDKFGKEVNEPEDSDNHSLDALRYAVMDLNKKKSWRVG